MDMGVIRDLMDIIANGYGSVSGGLDRSVATQILGYLQRNGWLSPKDAAYLVEAAGGEIRVSEEIVIKDAPLLRWWRDPANGDMVIRTREKHNEELAKNAKVNPDAEQRIRPAAPTKRC